MYVQFYVFASTIGWSSSLVGSAVEIITTAIVAHNAPNDKPLNVSCGSKHVQKELQPPTWYKGTPTSTHYCCSLDGDANHIVFFSSSQTNLVLLDGNKISVLIAHVMQPLLQQVYQEHPETPKITMGVVQTAYASGASTKYLKVRAYELLATMMEHGWGSLALYGRMLGQSPV